MEKQEFQNPFFAQFLEGDNAHAQAQFDETSPYKDAQTNKYPSDYDEDWPPIEVA